MIYNFNQKAALVLAVVFFASLVKANNQLFMSKQDTNTVWTVIVFLCLCIFIGAINLTGDLTGFQTIGLLGLLTIAFVGVIVLEKNKDNDDDLDNWFREYKEKNRKNE